MPILLQQQNLNEPIIGIWHITESTDQMLSKVVLDVDDQIKFNSFRLDSRKKEWLAIRIMVDHFLGEKVKIIYNSLGKPSLYNHSYRIGISHTLGFAAIILHPTKDVAIDIEYPSDRVLRISDRFLSDHEKAIEHNLTPQLFQTIIWCAKEAMFKWWDEHDVVFKEQLLIKNERFPNNETFAIHSQLIKNNRCIELPLQCCITEQYVLVYTL